MSTDEKIKNSQLYFIEKLFSFFKNESAVLSKRGESVRYLIKETINTSNEIKTVNSQIEVSRLSKALEYQINELKYVFENNPIFKNSLDIQQLIKLMKTYKPTTKKDQDFENNKSSTGNFIYSLEFNRLINSLISFEKKLNQESVIKEHFIKIQSMTDSLPYDQVDILIDSLISELLFVCSAKYLIEKLDKTEKSINLANLEDDLQFLCDNLAINTAAIKNHEFIFKLELPDKTQKLKEQLLEINSDFIFDIKTFKTLEDTIGNYSKAEEHLTSTRKHILYLYKEVTSTDIYKASRLAFEEVKNFLNTYILLDKTFKVEINVKGLYRESPQANWKMRDIVFRENNYNKVVSSREKSDIQTFINLRNKRLLKPDGIKDLFLIERAYNLSNNGDELTIENNLLNSWLSLEYLVTPYISNAIIEKVRQVIPKVVSLYYIKGLMNEVWATLNEYKLSSNQTVLDFIKECKNVEYLDSWRYQKVKFASQLKGEAEVNKVIESVSDRVLIRKLRELNGLLNKRNQAINKLDKVHQGVEFDLNRIYRIRNKIVHSGINIPNDLELMTLRLMNYNNCLLGTIVHYMTINDKVKLEDVLNSIVETYNWYIDKNLELTNIEDIITPEFLYL